MGRWGDGVMGRWGDGEMGSWGDGEMGRWGDGEMEGMVSDGGVDGRCGRRLKNCDKLAGFLLQLFQHRLRENASLGDQIQPEEAFICFLRNDRNTCREFGVAAGSSSSAIVGGDRRCRFCKLASNGRPWLRRRKLLDECENLKREALGAIFQLFALFAHSASAKHVRCRRLTPPHDPISP